MKDEETLGKSQYLGDISWEGSVLDRIETNFRLVMLSVRDLELAARSTADHVETMKNSWSDKPMPWLGWRRRWE